MTHWLTLIPVLALELGSSLSLVLVASLSLPVMQPKTATAESPVAIPTTTTERDKVAEAILSHVKASGGSVRGSYRALGKMLGADRNTVGRALHSLAASGLIALEASKQGSILRQA